MEVSAVILSFVHENDISGKKVSMITRKSFFIRWLLFRDEEDQQEKSVIDIEHIQSGAGQRVSSLEEASRWMNEIDADGSEKSNQITGD